MAKKQIRKKRKGAGLERDTLKTQQDILNILKSRGNVPFLNSIAAGDSIPLMQTQGENASFVHPSNVPYKKVFNKRNMVPFERGEDAQYFMDNVYNKQDTIPQYGLGSWIGDAGKLLADNMLSVVGANDVINDNAYKNKAMAGISKVTNKIGNLTGAVGAAVIPGLGAAGIGTKAIGAGITSAQKIGGTLGTSVEQEDATAQYQQMMQMQNNQQLAQGLPQQQQYTMAKGGYIDPSEIAHGTKEEMEHTSSKKVSKKTAMDHLKEDPKYYSKLKKAGLTDSFNYGGMMNSYGNGVITKANGGTVGDLDNTTYFSTGGLHKENGGIPYGENALVERGEFLWESPKGKYVFSNKF